MLESMFQAAESQPAPEPGQRSLSREMERLVTALAAVKAAGILTEAELARWQSRVDSLKLRLEVQLGSRSASPDAAYRRIAIQAEAHLRAMLERVAALREVRTRDPRSTESLLPQALGAAAAIYDLKLVSFDDYSTWCEMFADADRGESDDELRDEIEVAPVAVSGGRSLRTIMLDLAAPPWRVRAIEVLPTAVRIKLVLEAEGPRRYLIPRLAITDDLGSVYTRSTWRSTTRRERHEWQATFKPSLPRGAQLARLTVDRFRFSIPFADTPET